MMTTIFYRKGAHSEFLDAAKSVSSSIKAHCETKFALPYCIGVKINAEAVVACSANHTRL